MNSFGLGNFVRTLNKKIEPPMQAHLKNVYSYMALSTLAAGLGGYVYLFTGFISGGILSFLMALGCLIALLLTPDTGKNVKTRLTYLLLFAFLSGVGLGPLLEIAIALDPAIIPTAFLGTCLIFTCFTLASMFGNQRRYIYLGGALMSLLSILLITAVLNIFIGSYVVFQIEIYVGLAMTCAFILYDTQLILERRRSGDRDCILHSLLLLIDLLDLFQYLLIILIDKRRKKKKE